MRRCLLLALLAATTAADDGAAAIRWHLPADFAAARARAETENRLLIIKGISFGVDARGAQSATDGCW